jgi:hypothetical protein
MADQDIPNFLENTYYRRITFGLSNDFYGYIEFNPEIDMDDAYKALKDALNGKIQFYPKKNLGGTWSSFIIGEKNDFIFHLRDEKDIKLAFENVNNMKICVVACPRETFEDFEFEDCDLSESEFEDSEFEESDYEE